MLGLTTTASTTTNELNINIPDELKGIDLQIIILPASKDADETINFFTGNELHQFHSSDLGSLLEDNEDYSKW